jgi:hypothetical protein
MQNVPALRGRLSFSPNISKNFQIFRALSVRFKRGPYVDFFDNVSLFFPVVTAYWAEKDIYSLRCHMKGPKCP